VFVVVPALEDEVVIMEVVPKITGFDSFDCEPGTTSAICNYEKRIIRG